MSEFWILVDDEFGAAQGRALVRDHVIGALGHRTPGQALEAGEDPRTVWFALCDDLAVPDERRWGRDEPGRGARSAGRAPARAGDRGSARVRSGPAHGGQR